MTPSFNLRPGVLLGQAVDAIRHAVAVMRMPASIIGKFQGNAGAFEKSPSSLPWLVVLSLTAVYVILGVLYGSFSRPLVILSALPAAGLGALPALYVVRSDLSAIGIIGSVPLIGIVEKNGIMLVDFALKAEREDGAGAHEAVRQACVLRPRPILMTTAAAMLASVAQAAAHGTGSAFQRPLGFTIVGGLVLSQLLALYTTPVAYVWLSRLRGRRGAADGTMASQPAGQ